ncbi:MAG: LuxR C-terminal-related transcriptional regulator [Sphingomicrobium sp.]
MRVSKIILDSLGISPIAMVVTNPHHPDNPIEVANPAFCSLTGYSETEIVGRNCRFLAGTRTDERARQELRVAVIDKRPLLIDILNYRKNGSAFRNGVMIAPQFDEEGALGFFIGSQVDLGDADPALAFTARQSRAMALVATLPPRQRQVLEGIATGLLNKQIAYRLGIAEKTVKMHRALMLERLGGITTAEAIRLAVEAGL